MVIGSAYFNDYTRTLRRVYWAEKIDAQVRARRRLAFKASLISDPCEPRARRDASSPVPVDRLPAPDDLGA